MPIRVLLADESLEWQDLFTKVIRGSSDLELVGLATTGDGVIEMASSLAPDIVIIDAFIPQDTAIEPIRDIMDRSPVPIVVVCPETVLCESSIALDVMKAGALAILHKPDFVKSHEGKSFERELLNTVRAMANVHVIRHPKHNKPTRYSDLSSKGSVSVSKGPSKIELVCIVASTGGPQTLSEIIRRLPISFTLPIVIVQHITADFVSPLVNWLGSVTQLPVRIAANGDSPLSGTVYLAPGQYHLRLNSLHQFELSTLPSNLAHIPSGDVLLESVAQHYGAGALGIILTGMGNDGAHGLRAMYDVGALTVAQEEASCIVYGMPYEAVALGSVRQILTPPQIADVLLQYA